MTAPLVTVGLPCFNEQRFVRDAVKSIRAQGFTDWELIAVDDGSSDGTAEILATLRDPRIKVIRDGHHRGLAARLNEITRSARGRYVARMDADDVAHPQRLQRQVAYLDAHPETDVLGTGMAIVDRRGRVVGRRSLGAEAFPRGTEPRIAHATICCRKEWMQQHPYNERNSRCEDWELWRSAGQVAGTNLEELLYFYREFDSFGLRKYLGRQWNMMRAHARAMEVRPIASCALRCGIYGLAQMMGRTDALIARRSQALAENEQVALQKAYDEVVKRDLEETQQAVPAGDPH